MDKKFANKELEENFYFLKNYIPGCNVRKFLNNEIITVAQFEIPKQIFVLEFCLEDSIHNANNTLNSKFEEACENSFLIVRIGRFRWELYFTLDKLNLSPSYFNKDNNKNHKKYSIIHATLPGSKSFDGIDHVTVVKGCFSNLYWYIREDKTIKIYKQITECTNKALEGINKSHRANCILSAVDEFFPNLCDHHRGVITLRVLDNIDRKEPIYDKEALQNENATLRAKLMVFLAKAEVNKLKGEELIVSKDFTKNDQEKPRIDLIPKQALLDIAEILTFGANKYSPDNWKKANSPEDIKRIRSSLYRHLFANELGMINDDETGKSHLAHAACNLLFLMYFETENETKRS